MLNPFAGEFKPNLMENGSPLKKDKQKEQKKHTNDGRKKQTPNENTSTKKPVSSTASAKKKDSQANKKNKQDKRRASRHETAASVDLDNQFKEAKFIAIEAAINPIHRIHNTGSSNFAENQFEHGYERYVDWIDRSLKLYDMVTVVGMENAIADVVSLVSILQERKMGVHEEVETFTTIQENGRKASCIQVRLHSYF
ncbi:hypothetical protein G6F54_005445 [Rhizopus delemar]|nr:hypothetical protein G6F54_005445 [Rhizopus delemar]